MQAEKEKKLVLISCWIPRKMKIAIEKYVENDMHLNVSDFFRDAIREKIQKDAPELFKEIIQAQEE